MMEKEAEGEKQPKKTKLMAETPNWLDLPNPIATNIILEHLEVDDYIRFSAVCKEWLQIQKAHRIRYSLYPPASLLSFPWLRYTNGTSSYFYLPNKQKLYNIPFCSTRKIASQKYCKHGWFLLLLNMVDKFDRCLCIYNPVTGVQVDLPPLRLKKGHLVDFRATDISSPPSDPGCTIFIRYTDDESYFCRLNDNNGWKMIRLSYKQVNKIIIFDNKIYTISKCYKRIYIVDTLLTNPIKHVLKMDCSEICANLLFHHSYSVNYIGELVMVIVERYHSTARLQYGNIKDFQIYRADLMKKKWLRVESLGDHALFVSQGNIFSLPAVCVGCKVNTVYCAVGFVGCGVADAAFDLNTKEWTDGQPVDRSYINVAGCSWFLPTLDYSDVGKTTGA